MGFPQMEKAMVKSVEKALIVCTPGMEKELLAELKEVWPYLLSPQAQTQSEALPEIVVIHGGIEIPCDFFRAVQFNFFMKTATRILWRISEFKCRDLNKLYDNLKRVPWGQWLKTSQIDWHVSASGTRMNHQKRIKEILNKVIAECKMPAGQGPVDIYFRNHDDIITISIDLSGEALYKRSLQKKVGEAPFRESWAHFILRRMMKGHSGSSLSGIHLVDPFMGSGTFLLEAATFRAPNFSRAFAFQNLVQAPKLFKSATFSLNYKWSAHPTFSDLYGFDTNPEMVLLAKENFEIDQAQFRLKQEELKVAVGDAFKPEKAIPAPVWLVANPPWGARLPQDMKFEALATNLVKVWKPAKMALILPTKSLNPGCISETYKVSENISLILGGQTVDLLIFQCKE